MNDARDYILKRLSSRRMSIDEFNFEKLDAPPLSMFLTPYDIAELNRIATSLKLQAKPEVRYNLINNVMIRKGMEKFGSGTNRVIYRHPEFPNILFKIAADNIGLRDNPNEYRNQYIVKPFVTKTFEISPCGTVALVEKVNPIRSREEFISVADDIFEAITEFFVGRYVLADIGEQFFMNWGVREGFGPVLLDYPYIYELDGDKLYCCREDPTTEIGICGGLIDYDKGFNKLVCTKCGAIYKAAELKKNIENKMIKQGGKINMKITLKGSKGTKVIGENTTPFKEQQESVTVYKDMNVITNKGTMFSRSRTEDKDDVIVIEEKTGKTVDFTPFPEKTVNGVVEEDDKELFNPIEDDKEFQEQCKKKAAQDKAKKPPVEKADELVTELVEIINSISVDVAKKDTIIRSINKLAKQLDDAKDLLASSEVTKAVKEIGCDIDITNIDRDGDNLDVTVSVSTTGNIYSTSEIITIENVFSQDEADEDPADEEDTTYENKKYKGVVFKSAYIKDIADVFTGSGHKEVILMSQDGGQHFDTNNDGYIIGIDIVDEHSVDSQKMVSKKWFDSIVEGRISVDENVDGNQEDSDDEEAKTVYVTV